jgi:hypothetical protein
MHQGIKLNVGDLPLSIDSTALTQSSVPDLIKPPDLNQARVNKCLIALVNRKAVQKDNSTVGRFVTRSHRPLMSINRVPSYTSGSAYPDLGAPSCNTNLLAFSDFEPLDVEFPRNQV